MSMMLRWFIVPPWFQHALREWSKIPLPRGVLLSACRFYDEWAQVTYHGDQVVFGMNLVQATIMICITVMSWSSSSGPSS
jgi:hypothetical protein